MERRDRMPEVVYWGLWGIDTRLSALAFMWACIAAGAAGTGLAVAAGEPHWGMGFLVAAAWYAYSIRWVDRHAEWGAD